MKYVKFAHELHRTQQPLVVFNNLVEINFEIASVNGNFVNRSDFI